MEHRDVPYIVYEAQQARNERTVKRFIIVIIVLIMILFATNVLWLWMWSSYDYASSESSIDLSTEGGGNANYIGNDGNINNGEDNCPKKNENSNKERR